MRTFISINIPEEIQKEIKKIQDKLPEFIGKKTEIENLHLTLKFLGEINDDKINQVKEKLREIKFNSFEVEVNSIGVFSEKFIRIVWLHLSGVEKIQKQIDKKLSNLFEPEKRFMSHLTIARVKKVKDKNKFLQELKNIEIPKIKFNVHGFYLMKSTLKLTGPEYEIIEKYSLEKKI